MIIKKILKKIQIMNRLYLKKFYFLIFNKTLQNLIIIIYLIIRIQWIKIMMKSKFNKSK